MRLLAALVVLGIACSGPAPDTRLAAGRALASPTLAPAPTRLPSATLRASAPATPCGTDTSTGLAGKWRPSSVSILADRGSARAPSIAGISGLCLESDATWRYAAASGKWSAAPIEPADWKRWSMPAQAGLMQKIVLTDWIGGTADGPVDADQLTVVTRVGPPDYAAPGTLSIVFGR
jgi:hypothetical protein